jgi:hypothetical protein
MTAVVCVAEKMAVRNGATAETLVITLVVVCPIGLIIITLLLIFSR